MLVSELPPYLLKPYQKSRVKGHVQTIAFVQMRGTTQFTKGRSVEIALCENFTAYRERTGATLAWTKWVETKHADHEAAVKHFESEGIRMERSYLSLTDSGLLLPMNETDVRHFRSTGVMPRAALEYGSQLMEAIADWYDDERKKALDAEAARVAAIPPPPVAPPVLGTLPPSTAGSMSSDPDKAFTELDKVLAKVLKPSEEF